MDRRKTAYHEAGHAVVADALGFEIESVYRVEIISDEWNDL